MIRANFFNSKNTVFFEKQFFGIMDFSNFSTIMDICGAIIMHVKFKYKSP